MSTKGMTVVRSTAPTVAAQSRAGTTTEMVVSPLASNNRWAAYARPS